MGLLDDLRKDYDEGKFKPTMKYPSESPLKEGTVIDEEQSVRWNREQVQIHNAALQDAKNEYRRQENDGMNKLRENAIFLLSEHYNFSEAVAAKIWDHAFQEKHAWMGDVFYYADELAEIVYECMKLDPPKFGPAFA